MMKKFRLPIIGVLALFLSGCTLMMDDMPLTDEKYAVDLETVGFDEPYTQETEYGDVTFQYGDSTKVLKKAAFDYLLSVDADTILYFSDNIPTELLVQPGNYVSMGCSHTLPQGLCSKVLELTHLSGMYKMVTTRVEQEKVFDVFEMNLDMDYHTMASSLNFLDSTECKKRGLDPTELHAIDFSALDEGSLTRSIKPGTPWVTRADDGGEDKGEEAIWEDSKDEKDRDNVGNDNYSVETVPLFYLSTSDVGGEASWRNLAGTLMGNKFVSFTQKLSDIGLSFAFGADYEAHKKIRITTKLDPDPKKSLREQTIVDQSKILFKFDLTATVDRDNKSQDPMVLFKQVSKAVRWGTDAGGLKECSMTFAFPIPVAPAVVLFLRVAPHISVGINAVGSAQIEVNCPTTTTYVKTIGNDDVTPEDKKKPKTDGSYSVKIRKANICGGFSLTGGIEVMVGCGVGGGSVIVGLGAGFDLFSSFSANFGGEWNPDMGFGIDSNIEFNIGLQFAARLFAGNMVLPAFKLGNAIPIYKRSIKGLPAIGDGNSATMIVYPEDDKQNARLSSSFKFGNPGIVGLIYPEKFKPLMRVFYTENGEEFERDLQPLTEYNKISAIASYTFNTILRDIDKKSDIRIQPGFNFNGNRYFFANTFIQPAMTGQPLLLNNGFYITGYESKVVKRDEWDFSDDAEYDYDFTYTFIQRGSLSNAQYIDDNWKEWGVHILKIEEEVYPYDKNKPVEIEKFHNKYYPVNVAAKSGTYNIKFKLNTNLPSRYAVYSELYYVDKAGKKHTISRDGTDKLQEMVVLAYPGVETTTVPSANFKPSIKLK